MGPFKLKTTHFAVMQPDSSAPPLLRSSARKAPGPPDYYLLRRLRPTARDPIGACLGLWRQYGDITRLHWFGPHYLHICVHPAMVEHILQANWSNYSKGFFYKRLATFAGNGLLTSEGDLWLRQRRLAQPAFHRARIARLADLMAGEVGALCERWEREKTAEPFDVAGEMMRLTLQIAARALFGTQMRGAAAHRFHELMNIGMAHVEHRTNPLSLPEKVPTPHNRRFLWAKGELQKWILEIVHRRRTGEESGDDLLQMLVDARDEDTGEGMSDQQLFDEVITLLIAGHETSADALAWGFSLLARHPEKREELENEAKNALNGALPAQADLERLPYARQVFEESLRLYPPFWAIGRETLGDDVIGGYEVKARSTLIVPPFLTHRHPEFWPDPDAFKPDRFTPEQVAKRPKFAYFPFGGGPRLCIGQGFGLMEGQIALAVIASRFRLELAPFEKLVMDPSPTLRPHGGLWMTRTRI